jgi:beta-glucosidase
MEPTPEANAAYLGPRADTTAYPGGIGSAAPGEQNTGPVVPLGERPWMDVGLTPTERAALLLAAMTLDEKLRIVAGAGAGSRWDIQGVPRLGIPGGDNIDSGLGLRLFELKTTGFPCGLSLGSSFSPEACRAQGRAVGNEAFLTGHNHLLGPTIDIARNPHHGRLFENFGEDPLLTKRLGSANIMGIEENPVVAVVKHYVSNTQETQRTTVDEHIDERALREIYVPPFEGAVDAGAGAIMGSLNKVNSEYVSQSRALLADVLKGDLGFQGFVQTDFNSLSAGDTVTAALSGIDLDLPDGAVFGMGGSKLKAAIESGQVSVEQLDSMVTRVLTTYFSHALFDEPAPGIFVADYTRQELPIDVTRANDALAFELGCTGAVLLKNSGLLPLSPDRVRSIAVIGADAGFYIQGGGSSFVPNPTTTTSYLDGIARRSGATVTWVPGTDASSFGDMVGGPAPIPSSVLIPEHRWNPTDCGLHAEFFLDGVIGENPDHVRLDKQVNAAIGLLGHFSGVVQTPLYPLEIGGIPAVHGYAAKWTGDLVPPTTGRYTLTVTHWGSARLVLDGREIIAKTAGPEMNTTTSVDVDLTADTPASLELDYWFDEPTSWAGHVGAQFKLGWIPPLRALSPAMQEAADAAARSDVAIVVVRDVNNESADRGSLTLPQDQDRLISAVASANPNTIVIGATGSPYPMPWIDHVAAVLQTWYAGQQQGAVAASILYGDVNPSGRLPISFPRADEQQPINSATQWPGIGGVDCIVQHTEGIYVGYRGYDRFGHRPLFPFGFGLSYTTFEYSGLHVENPVLLDNGDDRVGSVQVAVRNTGRVAGTETVQVYAGELPTHIDTPSRQLIGWARVSLNPAETKTVSVPIDIARDHALSYWDADSHGWVTPRGDVAISVGGSAMDPRLEGTITIE